MKNYFIKLDTLDLIVVDGKDSENFLQGQLTCDLNSLSDPGACPGCLCDVKGRVIASFTLVKIQDLFYLEMAQGLGDIVLAHLKKYSVFYKTEMNLTNTAYLPYGLVGEAALEFLGKLFPQLPQQTNAIEESKGHIVRLINAEQQRFVLWLNVESAEEFPRELEQALPEGNLNAWDLLDHELGFYQLQAEDSGLFTPQELNYDLLGHISFKKGCYTGQEIVARMHYRGKAKKRLHRLHISNTTAPEKHQKIMASSGSLRGEVLQSVAISDNNYDVLAISSDSDQSNLSLEDEPSATITYK